MAEFPEEINPELGRPVLATDYILVNKQKALASRLFTPATVTYGSGGSSQNVTISNLNQLLIGDTDAAAGDFTFNFPGTLPIGFECQIQKVGTGGDVIIAGTGGLVLHPYGRGTTTLTGINDIAVLRVESATRANVFIYKSVDTADIETTAVTTYNVDDTFAESHLVADVDTAGGNITLNLTSGITTGLTFSVRKAGTAGNVLFTSDGSHSFVFYGKTALDADGDTATVLVESPTRANVYVSATA